MGTVEKIFGMFDKIDDIVYEPIKLICDTLRQPLKQIEIRNEKGIAEHNNQMQMQLEKFEEELELDRKRREMELSADERRLEEELNQMAMDRDLARRKDMIELEKEYRKEMADAAAQLANTLSNIEVSAREKILELYSKREKEYIDLQNKYKKELFETINSIKECFPGEKGVEIAAEELKSQLKNISERSTEFSKLLNQDMKNVFGLIDDGTREMVGLASKYFQPVQPSTPLLTNQDQKLIEE